MLILEERFWESQICPISEEMFSRIVPGQHKIEYKEQEVEGRVHGELEFGLRHLLQQCIDLALSYHV